MMKDYTMSILNDVMFERIRQIERWGQQDHDVAHWLMILGEEYGEACEAGCRVEFDPQSTELAIADLRMEIIQVAAVAVQIVERIDRGWNQSHDQG